MAPKRIRINNKGEKEGKRRVPNTKFRSFSSLPYHPCCPAWQPWSPLGGLGGHIDARGGRRGALSRASYWLPYGELQAQRSRWSPHPEQMYCTFQLHIERRRLKTGYLTAVDVINRAYTYSVSHVGQGPARLPHPRADKQTSSSPADRQHCNQA